MVDPHLAGSAVGYNMLWTHACATLAPAVFGFAAGTVILYFLVRTGPKRRTYGAEAE